jgi:hypothetical protein
VKGPVPSHHHAHQVEVHMQMYIEGMYAAKTENGFSYGWIPHNAGFGFLDFARPTCTGSFCVFGPVLSSPAHGAPSLAMAPI